MPGGNVIYLPQEETFGSALGKGVSGGLSSFVEKEMKRQEEINFKNDFIDNYNRDYPQPDGKFRSVSVYF